MCPAEECLVNVQKFSTEAGLMTYNLVMLSHVASSVVEFAKSQVEWMSEKILKTFEMGRYNPFQFRHVQLCHTHMDLMRIRSPKVTFFLYVKILQFLDELLN